MRRIVVIGASAGGLEPLLEIVKVLPSGLPAAVFVVQHTTPDNPGYLADILSSRGVLPARYPAHGERFSDSMIHVAPPDYHLMLDADRKLIVVKGPKENRTRPAIDPLFRSAALHYGAAVVGIVLSGSLDDGVSGLHAIKTCGGTAIVQDPRDAVVDSMPRQALRYVSVDYIKPAAEIGALIAALATQPLPVSEEIVVAMREEMEAELRAAQGQSSADELLKLGDPSLLTCPECHGALVRLRDSRPTRYRCHTGHAFTAESLLTELNRTTEESFWGTVRSLQETAMLLGHLAGHLESSISDSVLLKQHAQLAEERARAVKRVSAEHEQDARAILDAIHGG